ncbi:MAG: hypothetical protein ABIT01_00980 [Thermoanaerobaculia bacterium]
MNAHKTFTTSVIALGLSFLAASAVYAGKDPGGNQGGARPDGPWGNKSQPAPAPPAPRGPAPAELDKEAADDAAVHAQGGLVVTKSSGPQWSGFGRDFGDWYSLTSDPAPAGYVLHSHVFRLVGDRDCGAWARCGLVGTSGTQVTYQFQTQGHDEKLPIQISVFKITYTQNDDGTNNHPVGVQIDASWDGRRAQSVGLLKTRYVKAH